MKFRTLCAFCLLAAFMAIGSPVAAPAIALQGQTSTTLLVHAVVVRNCTVVTSPVDFGNYDPLVANRTQPLDSTGSVTVEPIAMNAASHRSGKARRGGPTGPEDDDPNALGSAGVIDLREV